MKKVFLSVLIIMLCMVTVFANENDRPSVAVVLSGGGAKGIAHIAALKALEEHGIPIDRVYGTSMGALIGGIYCAGYSPADIYSLVTDNDLNSMFKTILSPGYEEMPEPYNFDRNNVVSIAMENGVVGTTALLDDYAIMNFFDNAVGNLPKDINFLTDLEIPFTCNAADMINGGQKVFTEGDLITAMRASMSIPVAFEPVFSDDGVFTDGGLFRNIMVQDAFEDGYDIVIAVSLPTNARKLSNDNFKTLSGLVEGTLISALTNASLGQVDMATYNIPIDVTGFSVLGFDKGMEIYERGLDEVAKSESVIREIASLFSDNQKVFKDPQRHGAYFTKYSNVEKRMRAPAYDEQHEDAFAKTRLSLGAGGFNSFSYNKNTDIKKSFMVLPYFSARAFFKDIKGSRLSMEGKFKIVISQSLDLNVNAMYRFNKDKGERIYGLLGASFQLGSLGYWTDTKSSVSINYEPERKLGLNAGLRITNEKNHNITFKGYLDSFKIAESLTEILTSGMTNKNIYKRAEAGAVYYTNQATGFLGHSSTRLDALVRAGFLKTSDSNTVRTYLIAGQADLTFALSDKNSYSIDLEVFSSREPVYLRSSYSEYGGWDGIPGMGSNTLYREFIMAGGTFQHQLKEGFVDKYLIVQARAGVHTTEDQFLNVLTPESTIQEDVANLPFSNCINSLKTNFKDSIDLGVGIGIGLDAAIGGDVVVGIGFNNRQLLSMYFEVK